MTPSTNEFPYFIVLEYKLPIKPFGVVSVFSMELFAGTETTKFQYSCSKLNITEREQITNLLKKIIKTC